MSSSILRDVASVYDFLAAQINLSNARSTDGQTWDTVNEFVLETGAGLLSKKQKKSACGASHEPRPLSIVA
jgi:hypothetical protein